MKFFYEEIINIIEWHEHEIPILTIESKRFFNELIRKLYINFNFIQDSSIKFLDCNDNDLSKVTKLILEPFSLTANNKEVMRYLDNLLLQVFKEEKLLLDEILSPIREIYLKTFSFLPIETEVEMNFNPKQVSKLFKYAVIEDSESLLEQICDCLSTLIEMNIYKAFIFVNLKSVFDVGVFEEIGQFFLYEKIPVLFIENTKHPKISFERHYIIDADFCEIF